MTDSRTLPETIFLAARDLAEARERAAYLEKACGEDHALRERVQRMLEAEQKADRFLAGNPLELENSPLTLVDVAAREGSVIGCYKLLQHIGEGGCGIVYMAEQEQPIRRRVAVKLIKPGMDTRQVIARFEAERQALAMMDHPNIARVLDAGATDTGRPYFVMELVRGIKITEYCDQNNLATCKRLELFAKVVQAVQHAHQKGIIHRDLKPSNVLVTLHDGVPVPKVIDFGIAKALEQKLTDKTLFTQFEQFIGTPAYTSPEQAEMSGLNIDTRSDIYSLGVLLYELLVGGTPFDASDLLRSGLNEMRRIIRENEPARPSTRLSTMLAAERTVTAQRRAASLPALIHLLKGDLDWIVMKCLEKDRTRRYETASGLGADIQNYLSSEPVTARPPSASYRLGKLIRRNKLAFAAGAAVALALVAGIAASTWQAARARRAERAAQAERDSTQAVLHFFRQKVLAAGRPEGTEGGLGRDVTLRQAIDTAETQIAEAFKDRPLVEAAIRQTIGESYNYLGESALAAQQLERALMLRRQGLPRDDRETLDTMGELATAYWYAGKGDLALQLDQETCELRKAKYGTQDDRTQTSMANLGESYLRAGRFEQALPLLEEVLKLETATKGPESIETLSTMANVARVHHEAGRLDQALPLYEEAAKLLKTKWPGQINTLHVLANLAGAYCSAGKWDQGWPLIEETFKEAKTKLGPAHPTTIEFMRTVAFVLLERGQESEVEAVISQALIEVRESPTAKAQVLHLRGGLHAERGRLSEAIADFTEAIQIERALSFIRSRGIVRARLGQFKEAADDFAETIQMQPTDHELYHFLTACLVQRGDLEAYLELCRQIVARFAQTADPSVAHRMAKDCSILPASRVHLAVLERWADRTVAAGEAHWASQWFLAGNALVQYRQARHASAAETMHTVLGKRHRLPGRDVQAWMVLAMACHQLQQHDQARSALAQGLECAETKLPKRESGDLDIGGGWVDWVFAHALMREAQSLIGRETQ